MLGPVKVVVQVMLEVLMSQKVMELRLVVDITLLAAAHQGCLMDLPRRYFPTPSVILEFVQNLLCWYLVIVIAYEINQENAIVQIIVFFVSVYCSIRMSDCFLVLPAEGGTFSVWQ